MREKDLKFISIVLAIMSFGITIVSSMVAGKRSDLVMEDKVQRAVADALRKRKN